MNFEKFDKEIDVEGLQKDIKDAASNTQGEYKDVPHDSYEVSIEKLELTISKKGDPMVSCWMNILEGEFKKSKLFMNQVVTQGFQIHIANEFLRSLDSGVNVEFKTYTQYKEVLMDMHEAIDNKKEYVVDYGENDKGYNTFKITEVFNLTD